MVACFALRSRISNQGLCMKVWVVCAGEMLPLDKGGQRLMRAGLLVEALRARQHDVVWWTSAFDHVAKRKRAVAERALPNGACIELLGGMAYSKNISLRRLINHAQLAREFMRKARAAERPDLVFCCWPTIELGLASVRYGQREGVPVVLDVRDLWPDLFLEVLPEYLRFPGRTALAPYFVATRSAFSKCTAITGISENYLRWGLSYAARSSNWRDAVFPLGCQTPSYSPADVDAQLPSLREKGVDDSKLVCWFVGSFGETYDLEPVIAAARAMQNGGFHGIQFVLSGVGENGPRWQKLAQGLPNVVFTGWLNARQIACMMQIARVGLAAYRKNAPQGLPNKIFEYMSAGLPILSSLSGETEILLRKQDCGLSYLPGDNKSFLESLTLLLSDGARLLKYAHNSRRAFQTWYSASSLYPRLVRHLEAIVDDAASLSGPNSLHSTS